MNIFISYRRKTWPFTQRLAEKLRTRLGAHVFVDTDSIDNDDFDESILRHLRGSEVFVLVVSEQTFDPDRINRESDWVRREIGEALKLDLPIILAMVDGYAPPPPDQLPADIRDVTTKQGIEFYPVYFEAGVEKLAQFIREVLQQHRKPGRAQRLPAWAWIGGMVAVVGLVIAGIIIRGGAATPIAATPTQPSTESPTLSPTEAPTQLPNATPTRSPTKPVEHNKDWLPVIEAFDGMEMVIVPEGCFWMGADNGKANEKPAHLQCIEEPFWIGKTEVTNAQYGSTGVFSGDNRPRDSVNWFDANQYCAKHDARLPTEIEWEYAARGPDDLAYPWGNASISDYSVNSGNSGDQTAEVGSRPYGASWVGALDMSGNLWEWVSTIYQDYPYAQGDGENLNDRSSNRVLRGASWHNPVFDDGRTSFRFKDTPSNPSSYFGFRCVRDWQSTE